MGRSEHSTRAAPIEAVCFDVTHTLIHCPRLAEIYSEILERHGIDAEPEDIRRVVPRVAIDRRRPDADLVRLLGSVVQKRKRPAGSAGGGHRAGIGGSRPGLFPVLFTGVLAAAVWIGGCRRSTEEQKPPETVDVGPALAIPTDNDPIAVERPPELVGVLPGDFPEDLPLYLPASLIDFGAAGDGWRYVNLLTPHSMAQAESGLVALLRKGGWAIGSGSDGGRLLSKGTQRVKLRVEDARPGMYYLFEYR